MPAVLSTLAAFPWSFFAFLKRLLSRMSSPLFADLPALLGPKVNNPPTAAPAQIPALKALTSLPDVPLDVSCYGDALCATCTKINVSKPRFFVLPGDPEHGVKGQPDGDLRDLGPLAAMATRTSCPLCRLIYVTVGGERLPTEKRGLAVHVSYCWNTMGPSVPRAPWATEAAVRVLRLYVRTSDNKSLGQLGMFFPEITLLAADMPSSPYPGTHPESAKHLVRLRKPGRIDFDLVRKWLHVCRAHHGSTCRTNPLLELNVLKRDHKHPADEMPEFRCIDVARMCLTQIPSGTPYAALSYVWGRRSFYCTKRAAVAELEQPGSLTLLGDHLPQTIRDALQIAKETGIAYLWIDTLCIVQDDMAVKMATIVKMDMVYCAAELVIIAAGAPDAYTGIAGVSGSSGRPRQAIEQIEPGFRLAANARWQDYIDSSLYYTRGWTLQEESFSMRSLVFIGGTVVFRCRGADAWQEHIFEPEAELQGKSRRPGDGYDRNTINDIGPMEEFYNSYSERQLSFGSDLYNAFAGMARQLMVQYKTDLCHGLPTRFFDWHLLWDMGSYSHHVRCRGSAATDDGRGPSWSWSGWTGGRVWGRTWDWYTRDIGMVSRVIGRRTWIVWYQRAAHDSTVCLPLVRHMKGVDAEDASGSDYDDAARPYHARNLYGGKTRTKRRFPGLDCSQTKPTPVQLSSWYPRDEDSFPKPTAWPPTYVKDTLSENPGSGFLQFWTVSVVLKIDEPESTNVDFDILHSNHRRLGVYGKGGRELGHVLVEPDWLENQETTNGGGTLPQTREFILLCKARDNRAPNNGNPDRHKAGWRFKTMLIEWVTPKFITEPEELGELKSTQNNRRWAHGSIKLLPERREAGETGHAYAERVSLSSLGFDDLDEALGDGPEWKEIILG